MRTKKDTMKYTISTVLILFCLSVGNAPARNEVIVFMSNDTISLEEIDLAEQRISALELLHPTFRNKVVKMLYECSKQGITLKVVETYRTPERQDELRKKGVSMLHGGKSKHQHNLAIDVVPVKFGWLMWHDKELWEKVGRAGEKYGLKWGGRWKRFRDYPHFELPVHLDSVKYLVMPDTVLIPLNY